MKGNSLLALLLAASLVLTLAGCTITDSGETPPPALTSSEPSPTPAVNPLMEAEFKTDDVLSGSGEKIGEYGYIEMQKSDMAAVTGDQLVEFCESKVDGSGLYRVMVLFEDGTGIHITDTSWIVQMLYGTIDPDTVLISGSGLGSIERVQENGEMLNEFSYIPYSDNN